MYSALLPVLMHRNLLLWCYFPFSLSWVLICMWWAHVSFHCVHAGISKQVFYSGYSGGSISVSEELGSLALNKPYSLSFWMYLQSTEFLFSALANQILDKGLICPLHERNRCNRKFTICVISFYPHSNLFFFMPQRARQFFLFSYTR